jgi:hypothetical protein
MDRVPLKSPDSNNGVLRSVEPFHQEYAIRVLVERFDNHTVIVMVVVDEIEKDVNHDFYCSANELLSSRIDRLILDYSTTVEYTVPEAIGRKFFEFVSTRLTPARIFLQIYYFLDSPGRMSESIVEHLDRLPEAFEIHHECTTNATRMISITKSMATTQITCTRIPTKARQNIKSNI